MINERYEHEYVGPEGGGGLCWPRHCIIAVPCFVLHSEFSNALIAQEKEKQKILKMVLLRCKVITKRGSFAVSC